MQTGEVDPSRYARLAWIPVVLGLCLVGTLLTLFDPDRDPLGGFVWFCVPVCVGMLWVWAFPGRKKQGGKPV